MASDTTTRVDYTLLALKDKKKKSCVICKRPSTSSFYPFCSARCQEQDLGNWITESYYIPGSKAFSDQSTYDDEKES